MRWTRATVAVIENGLRKLDVGEFLALPYIFVLNEQMLSSRSSAPRNRLTLADFLPSSGGLEIARDCTLPVSVLRQVAAADVGSIVIPTRSSVPPEADEDVLASEALGDAEEKAARRLKVSAVDVAKAARQLWEESLTEKRDREVAAKLGDVSSPRTLQAVRGHVTRALTNVLRTALMTSSSGKTASSARIHDAASKQRGVRRRRRQSPDQQP
jgi:hypothetical protein